jgi:hypothetical protein
LMAPGLAGLATGPADVVPVRRAKEVWASLSPMRNAKAMNSEVQAVETSTHHLSSMNNSGSVAWVSRGHTYTSLWFRDGHAMEAYSCRDRVMQDCFRPPYLAHGACRQDPGLYLEPGM